MARLSDADASEIQAARAAFEEEKSAVSCAAMLLDVLSAARVDDNARAAVFQNASHWQENLKSISGSDAQILAQKKLQVIPPFHFPIAFPEVFLRDRPGST